MGDKVERDLCDERTRNIGRSLDEIKGEILRIRNAMDSIKKYACTNGNGMSTKKTIAVVGGIVVVVQTIAEILKAVI